MKKKKNSLQSVYKKNCKDNDKTGDLIQEKREKTSNYTRLKHERNGNGINGLKASAKKRKNEPSREKQIIQRRKQNWRREETSEAALNVKKKFFFLFPLRSNYSVFSLESFDIEFRLDKCYKFYNP